MIASEGLSIVGSGRSSTRMSPGAWSTAPRMVVFLSGGVRRELVNAGAGCDASVRGAGVVGSVAAEDLLGHGHRGEGLRPAGVEGQVGDGLDQLFLGGAVVLGELQVEGELLGVAAGEQCGDGDQAAVARRQLRSLPRVAEEHV